MNMTMSRAQSLLFCALTVLAVFVLSGGAAMAQQDLTDPSGLFQTFVSGEGDGYTNSLLNQIFGPIFPGAITEGGTTLFADIVKYFNAAMLVVAGILFFNNLVTGTVQSAHEGEVMGRNWSSLWAPLRTLFAVALLIPLPNYQGYNTAQVFVAFIAKNATNFASATWSVTVEKIVTGVVPVSAPAAMIPKSLASEMFLLEMCRVTLDEQFRAAAGQNGTPDRIVPTQSDATRIIPVLGAGMQPTGDVATLNPYKTRVSYNRVGANGEVKNIEICGYYETPAIPEVINNRVHNEPSDSFGLNNVLSGTESVRTQFRTVHETVMRDLSADMRTIAQSVYTAYDASQSIEGAPRPDITEPMRVALEKANRTLNQGYTRLMQAISESGGRNENIRQAMVDRISTTCSTTERACTGEGWIGAGSWYMIVARINHEISSLFIAEGYASSSNSARSEVSERSWTNLWQVSEHEKALRDQYTQIYGYGVESFNVAANRLASMGWAIDPALVTNIAASINGDEIEKENQTSADNKVASGMNQLMSFLNSVTFNQDPMIAIVNVGQMLVPVGVGFVVSDLFLPGNIASSIGALIATAGASMAIVLPLMPFIFWVMAVSGYFLLIVEAFIAVNLWAISHLRMDGDGLTGGAGREGWLMILALMVTPFLMIAGFIVGMIIFRITASLISMGLSVAVAGVFANGNWAFIMMSVFVIVLFMFIIYLMVIERSFSLVAEFPSKVLRWMGAAANLETNGVDRVRAGAMGAIGSTHQVLNTVTKDTNLTNVARRYLVGQSASDGGGGKGGSGPKPKTPTGSA